jgi:hypothetical protein
MWDLLLDVQIVFFDIGWQGGPSKVFIFVHADLPIVIAIILLHQNYIPDSSYLQHYTVTLGRKFKHLIGNEDWLSSAIHVDVLFQGGLRDSAVNRDSLPAWP